MPLKSIRAWLGVDRPEKDEFEPLGKTLEALDHLEPRRNARLDERHAQQHGCAERLLSTSNGSSTKAPVRVNIEELASIASPLAMAAEVLAL